MIHFDHICLAAQNVYEATFRLSRETGLGNYDGGFFPLYGIGHKVVPLAPDIYIEVEGIVDHRVLARGQPLATFFEQQTRVGDCFVGWCLRADSLDELKTFARHHNTVVDENTTGKDAGRQMMNGERGFALQTPSALTAWPIGKPNLYFKPGNGTHAASLPIVPGTGSVQGKGLNWIEIGEDEAAFAAWLGEIAHPSDFPFEIRYNRNSAGLYALGVETSIGEQEIRRAPVKI
ncbi:VOC family protein [Paraburkholderia sp. BCC1886]|uniref:VOC family protein n=1 Tax=Paraburkholderia sp. BCC1886 TaxID=2562670 RepID=UPI00118416DD|nr:VOC family protein [Paraburkholderia sp. BCC1886]